MVIRNAQATYLVGLDGGDLLIEFNIVTNLLAPLLQSALSDGLSHLRHFDNGIGVGADMVHIGREREAAQRLLHGPTGRDKAGRRESSSGKHVDAVCVYVILSASTGDRIVSGGGGRTRSGS